ncbi:MAG: response regulator [Actinobacteria bacterium]|nr:MAG: response regulator [Actinomycetota bacterium]
MSGNRADKRKNYKLRALLANATEGSIVIDSEGKIQLMNEAAERLLGLSRVDVMGKAVPSLRHSLLEEEIEHVLALRDGGERFVLVTSGANTLSCKVAPFQGPDRGGAIVSIRDETELVRQQERAEAILSSTGDGLIVFAPDNRVTYINPSACDMLGLEAESVFGNVATMSSLLGMEPPDSSSAAPCWEMLGCTKDDCPAYRADDLRCWLVSGTMCEGDGRKSFKEKMNDCCTCDVYVRNSRLLEECGMSFVRELTIGEPQRRILKIRTNPVIDSGGHYIGCVKSLHDITAEREISQMKNEFVSTVSHELRTPLTSIKGYVDLILDGEAGEINEIQQEFLTIVKQNSDRLVSLINDLLDISRIESGRIHLKIQPIDVQDSIQGAVNTFRAVLDQTGMELITQMPKNIPHAAGDRDRVGQVLTNLISNAIKYSPGGGTVSVKAKQRENQIVFSVSDSGIGISKDDQEKLFSKFFRVDSSLTREIGGTGLGLNICKTIIELLGGQIWVESQLGKGSTFHFTLPVAPKELVRMPAIDAPVLKGGKVLVVDRSPEIANLIEIYLRKEGYEVFKAFTAEEVKRKAVEHRPDVITLDVMLEEVDGFELLQQLKDSPDTASIPVVILSVVCDEGKSLRFGAANYLEKPINPDKLTAVINQLCGPKASPLVLIVDDDTHIVEMLRRTLKKRGFAVSAAYNGLEAMAAIKKGEPDLILLDLRMPEMDGYQVIECVKKSEATKHIPIVVMTAYHFDMEKIDILNLAAEQVSKPFEMEQLAEKVATMLDKERVER